MCDPVTTWAIALCSFRHPLAWHAYRNWGEIIRYKMNLISLAINAKVGKHGWYRIQNHVMLRSVDLIVRFGKNQHALTGDRKGCQLNCHPKSQLCWKPRMAQAKETNAYRMCRYSDSPHLNIPRSFKLVIYIIIEHIYSILLAVYSIHLSFVEKMHTFLYLIILKTYIWSPRTRLVFKVVNLHYCTRSS